MMRKIRYLFDRVFLLCIMHYALCMFTACEEKNDTFRLEGKFLNFNQGELYIYSLDRGLTKKDTIRLSDGRFVYEIQLRDSATFSLVFPNYSEIPVIAHPGDKVSVKGDASHLRETEVTGTEDNEQLTQFRLKANNMTPPEVMKSVYTFVKDHPRSPASRYLMNKHFLLKPDPDYKQALQLVGLMIDADPKNDELYQLKNQLTVLKDVFSDKKLPKFSAVTIDGKKVSEADLKAEVNVVLIWASWNFDTLTMQRQLKKQKNTYGSRLSVVGISLDGSLKECKDAMKRDSISWPTVCDGRLWQSPVIQALGVYDIPSNFIVTSSGKILATNLGVTDLRNKVDELLKVHTQ